MAAIALAITNPSTRIIITDSKTAIKAYDTGKVSKEAAKILQAGKNVLNDLIRIIWAPAHSGLTGNEMANEVARGLTHQAPGQAYYSLSKKRDLTTYRVSRKDIDSGGLKLTVHGIPAYATLEALRPLQRRQKLSALFEEDKEIAF